MKSRQFCSVCKEWLEMEVVPTSDGEEDDGVIWFRCPQCQGFLPKLSGAELQTEKKDDTESVETSTVPGVPEVPSGSQDDPSALPESGSESMASSGEPSSLSDVDKNMPWDSPADMMEARQKTAEKGIVEDGATVGPTGKKTPTESTEAAEPLHEYAALLAEKDQSQPTPYRPWESYEVGQCIHHQAWEDCGVVVAKEKLPGGRQIIKCYFEEAGVVRLIEMAPR
jgi:hypothetical protein